jgi:hypothetical protein
LGPRVGDGADVAVIELLGSELEVKKAKEVEADVKDKAGKVESVAKDTTESEGSEGEEAEKEKE